MSILNEIFEHKRIELAETRARRPDRALEKLAAEIPLPLNFLGALTDPSRKAPRLIAEVKRRSPSKGVLRADLKVQDLARTYSLNGAAAISVLTDQKYFGGSLETLDEIAALNLGIPLLRKDFVFHRYQLLEARYYGASAVLLIVAMLLEDTLQELIAACADLGLKPLVEIHTRSELETALQCGATLLGINNRNLHTFEVRLETTLELCQRIPPGVIVVAESGIQTEDDIRRLANARVDAMLVGESLVIAEDIAGKVRQLAQTAKTSGVNLKKPAWEII